MLSGKQRRARAKAGEREHDHVGRLVDLRRDPVAGLDAERDKRVRRPSRALDERVIGQRGGVARLQGELDRASGARAAMRSNRFAEACVNGVLWTMRPALGANAHTLLAEAVSPRDLHTASPCSGRS